MRKLQLKEARGLKELDTTNDPAGQPADRSWIAVAGQWRKGYGRLPVPYVHALDLAGANSKILTTFELLPGEEIPEDLEVYTRLDPYDPSVLANACGLLLPGGGDIDPGLYGKPRHPRTHNVSQRRDRFELSLLEEALERDMPVLCICRGMQLLNVHLGGTLDQHLLDTPGRLDHYRDRPIAEPAHGLHIKEGTILEEIVGSTSTQINTHHHQGLLDVADPLEEIGWSEDGVLEAVISRDHSYVLGVQWHPEPMAPVQQDQLRIFESFVSASKAYEAGGSGEMAAQSA